MTIEIVNGCLLEAFDKGEVTVMAHCCNMQNVMGAGIAKQIKSRYPKAFEADKQWYRQHKDTRSTFSCAVVGSGIIFNVYGQVNYGRQPNHMYLDYELLKQSLMDVAYHCDDEIIGLPYGIGCGLAGGDWSEVLKIIEEVFQNCKVKIYKLGE